MLMATSSSVTMGIANFSRTNVGTESCKYLKNTS